MNIIKCAIIDDEPLSRDVLRKYITDHEQLLLVGECVDALEAGQLLRNESVDLIFLDVNMPILSGIHFYKGLVNKPAVIFSTAYPNYAVEGFELNAIDYLVKPFGFDRFYLAIEKALNVFSKVGANVSQLFLVVKTDKKIYKVSYDRITYIESIGDYAKIHTTDKTLIVSETLKNYELKLPKSMFLRTHKSYIISLKYLEYVEGNQVQLEDVKLPIGKAYREGLKNLLK